MYLISFSFAFFAARAAVLGDFQCNTFLFFTSFWLRNCSAQQKRLFWQELFWMFCYNCELYSTTYECVYTLYTTAFSTHKNTVLFVMWLTQSALLCFCWIEWKRKCSKESYLPKAQNGKRSESLWDLCRDMCTYVLSLCMYNIHVRRVKYLVIKSKVEEKKPENQTKSHHNFFLFNGFSVVWSSHQQ